MRAPILAIEALRVAYGSGDSSVLSDLSLSLAEGEIGCIVGSSGCGKTTLLRAIAGFLPVQAGVIRIAGAVVSRPGETVPPERRGVGLVFQDYALFPHLRVIDNVAFGLRRLDAAQRARRAREMLALVGLSAFARRYPHELSGGQQQRVALARALAPAPKLLLMDEPFSSLDVELRARLSSEVRQILKDNGTSAIFVTHDQQEAFAIADRVGVMHGGRLEQWDRPYELYHRPATRYVADFIGEGVFLPARVLDRERLQIELGELRGDVPLVCESGCDVCGKGCYVDVLLRPDDVVHDDTSPLTAEVVRKVFRGGDFVYTLKLASGREVLALVPSHHDHAVGERIGIRLDADHVVTFRNH
ncbi:MAG: ABC transporter ATP-binding protein [Sutterellaceae bacterium]|nr:ABC transporter ATP-binding protein [Burkholderiaceae bacterium]MCX7902121.1 ABC transporter ATP-binding protein [Burkholderiaceae bacterium]MDW8430747.1 ABC transporter ATP-binding protein [Sutterellaceae bacterium]